jgi:hypothetical protein
MVPNKVNISFTKDAVEKLIAMKVRTNAPDLSTVVYNACSVYMTLLENSLGQNYIWFERGDKLAQLDLYKEGDKK